MSDDINSKKIIYSSTVTLGNIITLCTIVGIAAAAWTVLGSRVSNAEMAINRNERSIDERRIDQRKSQDDINNINNKVIVMDERQRQMNEEQTKQRILLEKVLDAVNKKLQ